MNREETINAITVMQAWADGKEIEYRESKHTDEWQTATNHDDSVGLVWDWWQNEYRIKPQVARYRRFLMHHEGHPPMVCITNTEEVAQRYHAGVSGFVRWIDTDWQEETV